jgi:hypothetical protein
MSTHSTRSEQPDDTPFTRRQWLEVECRRVRRQLQNARSNLTIQRLELRLAAIAELAIKWARNIDDVMPMGQRGSRAYFYQSLRRHQLTIFIRDTFILNDENGLTRRVQRLVATDVDSLGERDDLRNDPRHALVCESDARSAWTLVLSIVKTHDRARALRLRLSGLDCAEIAHELRVSHACVRQWFSRDLPGAFMRADLGAVWKALSDSFAQN